MNIAIDVSPLNKGNFLSHRVRGTGFYIENLKKSLLTYFPNNDYSFFTRGEKFTKDVDLVHYPYFEPFFLTLPLFKKAKNVVTVHDLTPFVFPKYFPCGIKGYLKWQIQKFSLKKADMIITDSQCSKKDIAKFTGIDSSKIAVVYLAAGEEYKRIESSKLKIESLRKKYNLPERFVLYVGDATWNKNLPRLISAVQKSKIPLVLVGKAIVEKNYDKNNPWNQDLVMIHELIKGDKNVLCLGFIPTDDLVLLYNIASVFVMPSLYEGFGLPILEAMSCGCPVVTAKGGSLPEIGHDAVFYVEPESMNSIAEGVSKVFFDEVLKKQLSQKGLLQSKNFNWKKTASETLEVYKKIIL